MNDERALLTKVLEDNAFQQLVRRGVKAKWFTDEVNRRLFYWISRFYERYGRCPSFVLTNQKFPGYVFEDTEDPLEALIDAVREKTTYIELQRAIKDVAVAARENPTEGLQKFVEEAAKLSGAYKSTTGINAADEVDRIIAEYESNKSGRGIKGFPWPWEPLNKATMGICPGTFHCLYGPPGSKKTWLLLVVAEFLTYKKIPVIFFTNEMLPDEILIRYGVLKSQVDYEKFQDGKLSDAEEKRFHAAMAVLRKDPPFLIEQITEKGTAGVLEMKARAQDSGARVIFFDGFKYISKSPKWDDFFNLVQSIREHTLTTKIPFVGTHHASKERQRGRQVRDNDADDVGWGEALQQLVTGLWRLNVTPQDEEDSQIQLSSRKTRERRSLVNFYIHAEIAGNFGFKGNVEDDDTPHDDDGNGYGIAG